MKLGHHSTHAAEARDALIGLLKRTMPFQVVSDELLARIALLAHRATYAKEETIYRAGDAADDIFIIVSGRVDHILEPDAKAWTAVKVLGEGEVFGWAALLRYHPQRLATTTALERTSVVRLNGNALVKLLQSDPETGDVVMSRFATMINREFTVPEDVAVPRRIARPSSPSATEAEASPAAAELPPKVHETTRLELTMFRMAEWLRSPQPYLMVVGYGLFLGFWYLAVQVWKLPRFSEMPGLTEVVGEWFSRDPSYGLSIYTGEYYEHILVSVQRVTVAFFLATAVGVPLGLFLGWSERFKEYVFPVFELLRPVPPLAWVPLAIIMFKGSETPIIFLTYLASFYATALNTMLGVESIDQSYVRAAFCLGARRWQVFWHVIVPGALPFVFTGLQISVGVAWFSLVAAEMVSGQYGLGYVINTSYTMVRYPTIVIGMVTLGIVGYITSAGVRVVGHYLMQWRERELALGGQR